MSDAMSPPLSQPPAALLAREDVVRIALVRHGETFQNREHVVQGQHPHFGRLTEAGMIQARLLGKALAARPFEMVHSSPLERAVLTTALILLPRAGDRTLPLAFPPELREIHLGPLQGRPHAEWKAAMNGAEPMTWRSPGGESWQDVQDRVTRWFRQAVLDAPQRTVLIVAHGGVNRGLIASLTGLTMGEAWQGPGVGAPQDNTCLNDLLVDREGRLQWALVNDSSHLLEQFAGASRGQLWQAHSRSWELLGDRPFAGRGADFDPYA